MGKSGTSDTSNLSDSQYTFDYYSEELSSSSNSGMAGQRTLWGIVQENKKAIAKYIFFFLFLAVVVIVVNNTRASFFTFEFNQRLRERFAQRAYVIKEVEKSMLETTDASEMWVYIRDYMLPGVYENTYGVAPDTVAKTETNQFGTILQNLRRVGAPRIRQLRMKRDTCDVQKRFRDAVDTCVAEFRKDDQDKAPYGPGGIYTYDPKTDENRLFIARRVYAPGGYFITLGPDLASSVGNVSSLIRNRFVDEQTRLIDYRMSFYNPYLDTVSVVTLAWEFFPSGGARPFASFHTVELNGFGNTRDAAYEITFEMIMWAFTVVFCILQIILLFKQRMAYFRDGWNWLNFVILILLLLTIAFRATTIAILNDFEFTVSDPEYVDFSDVEFLRLNERRTLAGVVFLMFFASFQFFESNPKLNQLLKTVQEAGVDVILFLVVILIVVMAFVFSGQLLFAETIEAFAQFSLALSQVFRFALGDFNYEQLEDADYSFGPLYFFAVLFILLFLMLNMFLALVLGAHERVMSSVDEQKWAGARPGPLTEAFSIITNELHEFLRRHPDRATDLLGIETAKDLYSRFDPEHPLRLSRAEQRALVAVLDTRRQNLVLLEHLLQLEQKLGFGASTTDEADGINLAEELSSYY